MIWDKIWAPKNAYLLAQDNFWKFAIKKWAEADIAVEDLPAAASQAADDYFVEIENGAD